MISSRSGRNDLQILEANPQVHTLDIPFFPSCLDISLFTQHTWVMNLINIGFEPKKTKNNCLPFPVFCLFSSHPCPRRADASRLHPIIGAVNIENILRNGHCIIDHNFDETKMIVLTNVLEEKRFESISLNQRVKTLQFFFDLFNNYVVESEDSRRFFNYTGAQIMEYFLFHRASYPEDYIKLLGDKEVMTDKMWRSIKRFIDGCFEVHKQDERLSPLVIVAMNLLVRPAFFIDRKMVTNVDGGHTSKKPYQEHFNVCGRLCLKFPFARADLEPFEEALHNWQKGLASKQKVLPGTQDTLQELNKPVQLCSNILQLKKNLFELISAESTEQIYLDFAKNHWLLDAQAVADLHLLDNEPAVATETVLQILLTHNHLNATLGKAQSDGNCGYYSIADYFNAMILGTTTEITIYCETNLSILQEKVLLNEKVTKIPFCYLPICVSSDPLALRNSTLLHL